MRPADCRRQPCTHRESICGVRVEQLDTKQLNGNKSNAEEAQDSWSTVQQQIPSAASAKFRGTGMCQHHALLREKFASASRETHQPERTDLDAVSLSVFPRPNILMARLPTRWANRLPTWNTVDRLILHCEVSFSTMMVWRVSLVHDDSEVPRGLRFCAKQQAAEFTKRQQRTPTCEKLSPYANSTRNWVKHRLLVERQPGRRPQGGMT